MPRSFLARRRSSDVGATDPILVIAAIAVSLILLVGGSFAVSGMIDNGKDLNAKADLDKVATAETAISSGGGTYLSWAIDAAGAVTGDTAGGKHLNEGDVGFTSTPGDAITVNANGNAWVAGVTSTTGKKFFRSSKQSTIYADTIPTSAYDNSLANPGSPAPYNATADCTNAASDEWTLRDSGISSLAATVTGTTVTVTFNATGTALCGWAKTGDLNLGGDSVVSGKYPAYDLLRFEAGNADGATQQVSVTSLRMDLTTTGTPLSSMRTVTITAALSTLAPYSSAADLVSGIVDTGLLLTIVPTNGHSLHFDHEGPNMSY